MLRREARLKHSSEVHGIKGSMRKDKAWVLHVLVRVQTGTTKVKTSRHGAVSIGVVHLPLLVGQVVRLRRRLHIEEWSGVVGSLLSPTHGV